MSGSDIDDFNESRYASLIDAAKARFSFCKLGDDLTAKSIALWRHDVDFSPHRALALARIENERAVPATFFVLLSSSFYNVFEPGVVQIVKDIAGLGHNIGLHYDASLLPATADIAAHEQRLGFEANTLSGLIGKPVTSFSLHNPTVSQGPSLDGAIHAGLMNASSTALRQSFEYCSDSNGIWRFRSLHDVVSDKSVRRLYALTHAEWWTPESMTPHQRLRRAVEGRASAVLAEYEDFLRRFRPEVLDVSR